MSQLQDVETAVSVCYVVQIDGQDLGAFTGCEGIGCEVVLETREEGGNNGFVWQLPSRLKFPNVKLTRPLGRQTESIATWISGVVTGYTRQTAVIQAMTADGAIVAEWSLHDVVPVRWTGPQLTPDQPKVLTETLEIAHHGFLPAG
ncbi:phage tail protein [Nocardioides humi]|uniref:Phage tail protein n=1 Tax=Nocardioides humi TaxID=449461 RepID=A0ABN2B1F5_9ACTN|nr:phage tail protein [Nocardioides humi]